MHLTRLLQHMVDKKNLWITRGELGKLATAHVGEKGEYTLECKHDDYLST